MAEIFPPKSRQNPGERPLCYFYAVANQGLDWRVDARLKWKGELTEDADNPMPYRAVVSTEGHLVTMNDLTGGQPKNSVAIYDPSGKLVKSYGLREIITKKATASLPMSAWTRDAKFYFLRNPARLYILPSWGQVMEFMLDDGAVKPGEIKDFPDLAKLLDRKGEPNEKTEIWATSLRFSSITDVLAAKKSEAAQPLPAIPGHPPQGETVQATKLKTAPSPMRLLASGVKFAGEAFSGHLDRSSQDPEITIGEVTYCRGVVPDGLVAQEKAAGTRRVFGMFDLAIAGGWYKPQGNEYLPQGIGGLWREGSRLWMGSNGVGVLAYDTQAGTWSRHDMKETAVVGHHATVCFADAEFVFAGYGYHRNVPAAVPSLHVFSVRHRRWLEITAIPTKDALRLGSSEGLLVARGWNHRRFAKQAYVPIGGGQESSLGYPHEIYRRPDGSYVLRYGWKDRESSWTELLVRPADLRAAFADAEAGAASQPQPQPARPVQLSPAQRRVADELVAGAMAGNPAWPKISEQLAKIREELAQSVAELAKREKKPQGWVAAEQVGRYVEYCCQLHIPIPVVIDEKVVDEIIFQYRNPPESTTYDLNQHRGECVEALGILGHPKAVPVLVECLKDKDRYGPYNAAWRALRHMADEAFLPVIAEQIDSKRPLDLGGAASCLGRLGRAGIPLLERILESPESLVGVSAKGHAIDALLEICLPECLPPLEKFARSGGPLDNETKRNLQAATATIRCRAVDRTYVPLKFPYEDECRLYHLANLAVSEEERRREDANSPAEAQAALLKFGPSIAVAALRPQLSSYMHGDTELGPIFFTSKRAAEILVRIGDPAIPALLDALNDKYDHTRGYAAQALKRITGQDLGSDYTAWRAWCLKAGQLGPAAPAAQDQKLHKEALFDEQPSRPVSDVPEQSSIAKDSVERLINELTKRKPAAWELIRETGNVTPAHRPTGPGTYIQLRRRDPKPGVAYKLRGIHLWLMSPEYTADPPRGATERALTQSGPASEWERWNGGRVFIQVGGETDEDWPDWPSDLKGALVAAEAKKPVAGGEDAGWGEAAGGLRCRARLAADRIPAGVYASLSVEVECVAPKPMIWQCGSGSLAVRVPGFSPGGSHDLPDIHVHMGQGARRATYRELKAEGIEMLPLPAEDAPVSGYYRLEPGGRLTLVCPLPYYFDKPGKHTVDLFIYLYPGKHLSGAPLEALLDKRFKTEITSPSLTLEVTDDRSRVPTSAADALKDVKERIDKFVLSVQLRVPAGNPLVRPYVPPLTLSVPPFHREGMPDGVGHPPGIGTGARISAEQAEKILHALEKAGFFQRARRFLSDGSNEPPWPKDGHCHIRITAWKGNERNTVVAAWLPWKAEMLVDLDAIRRALDAEAAQAMDELLSALADQRKQWAEELIEEIRTHRDAIRAGRKAVVDPAARRKGNRHQPEREEAQPLSLLGHGELRQALPRAPTAGGGRQLRRRCHR